MIQRSFTADLGDNLHAHYLRRPHRGAPQPVVQVYVGRIDPMTGNYDPFWQHVDEFVVPGASCGTRKEITAFAHTLLDNDDLRAEIADAREES